MAKWYRRMNARTDSGSWVDSDEPSEPCAESRFKRVVAARTPPTKIPKAIARLKLLVIWRRRRETGIK